ncbi:hypothetical protein WDL1CHR_04301 [Variovorax sp. WDL1]|nr:hypothetical protein CHC07_01469 [Variovorax sp. B4]PNG60469.1 hypothetical protein CHC06_00366 [Variovorax sp. B2]VTV13653.1 hypothetical protein WDL1CHR_04301 [Variovorax sp. WDL1]
MLKSDTVKLWPQHQVIFHSCTRRSLKELLRPFVCLCSLCYKPAVLCDKGFASLHRAIVDAHFLDTFEDGLSLSEELASRRLQCLAFLLKVVGVFGLC